MGCPGLPSAMAARAGELGVRALLDYGFKVLCDYCLCQWLLAIDDWPWLLVIGYGLWISTIGYGYWLLIFTLKNVAMVITHWLWLLGIGCGLLVIWHFRV